MPVRPFTIIAIALLGIFLQAETLSDFKTRLVADGLINSAGEITAVIDLGSHETATGQRPLSEVRFRVTVTTKEGGLAPGSYRVLVFDLNDPDGESVHDSDASQRNYEAPAVEENTVERAKKALDAALGAGNWKFHSIAGEGDSRVVKVRIGSALKAFSFDSRGNPISVDAE